MLEWLQLGLLFLVVASFVLAIAQVIAGRRAEAQAARLEEPGRFDEPTVLTQALATPMTEAKRAAIRQELREAGFYQRTAVFEYAAVRTLLVIAPLAIAGMLALAVPPEQMGPYIVGGLIAAVACYSAPRLWVNWIAARRKSEIERGMPVAVDLIALSLTGGQSLSAAVQRAGLELRSTFPSLAAEMAIVQRQAELGGLQPALNDFADRTRVPEVRHLAMVLAQSERLGSDLTSSLLELSSNYRTTLRQRAEAQANRASFWMLFPTILFLWIPAALVLIGPLYLDFVKQRSDTKTLMQSHHESAKNPSRTTNVMPDESTTATEDATPPAPRLPRVFGERKEP